MKNTSLWTKFFNIFQNSVYFHRVEICSKRGNHCALWVKQQLFQNISWLKLHLWRVFRRLVSLVCGFKKKKSDSCGCKSRYLRQCSLQNASQPHIWMFPLVAKSWHHAISVRTDVRSELWCLEPQRLRLESYLIKILTQYAVKNQAMRFCCVISGGPSALWQSVCSFLISTERPLKSIFVSLSVHTKPRRDERSKYGLKENKSLSGYTSSKLTLYTTEKMHVVP